MSSPNTFFLSSHEWQEPYTLKGQDFQHLTKVLRAKPGDRLNLIDGQGRQGAFELEAIYKNKAVLSEIEIWTEAKADKQIYLALGWNKSLRRSWFLEKSVELEAAGVYFWQADRSQGQVPFEPKSSWQEQLIAGAKQCANPWLPELRTFPKGIDELISSCANFDQFLFLWEELGSEKKIQLQTLHRPCKTLIVIGPEGGFSSKEVKTLLNHNYEPASLGKRILRWETAALISLGMAWFT